MYLCARGFNVHRSLILIFDFVIVPTVWYVFYFIHVIVKPIGSILY
jgi:hypothetical protein